MIKLIVDTTCDIYPDEAEKLGIISIPMKVYFDDTEYIGGVNLSNEEFYKKLQSAKNLPTTTQINVFTYTEAIKPWLDKGDEVFVMCLSDKLSGSYNNLEQAAKELNSPKLEILNTHTVSFGFHALVLEAIKLINQDCNLKQLKEEMSKLCDKMKLYTIIENARYLIKGGRLSLGAGLLAKTLNIKPIVAVENGGLKSVAKTMGYLNAKRAVKNFITDIDTTKSILVGYSNDKNRAEDFGKYIEKECGFKITKYSEIGPIIGTHAGPGCVGITYFQK